MPRFYPLVSSFSTGVVTEKILGQVTLAKYQNACTVLDNYIVQQQGGVTRRPGTRLVALSKLANKRWRAIPFVFNINNVYMLEVGEGYIRFYRNRARIEVAGTPVEVSTPYIEADLRDIDTRQSADVLYFFHPSVATRKLERYSDTIWRFREVDFEPPPSFEFGARPVGTLTPSATTGTVTLTASTDAFQASDVGREVVVTGGANAGARASITVFTSVTQVTAVVSQDFISLAATAAGNWKITESPKTIVTLGATGPVGIATTATLSLAGWRGTVVTTDSDCGRFAVINGAQAEIVTVTSTTVAQVILRGTAGATVAQSGEWTLEEALWSTLNGFVETGTFFEDRLYLGAGYYLAGSKSSDYENFGVGVLDDDAVVFALNSDEINAIRALAGAGRRLLILTSGGEFSATGGTDTPITASNIQVVSESAFGSSGVGPIRVGNLVLFVQRSSRKLRELVFSLEQDSYLAPDLTILAEHLTRDATIVELAHHREPDSIVWALRDDGMLLGCTYLRDQNVVAWHRHPTDGLWETAATIPTTGKDETWLGAARTINGSTARTVEVIDDIGLTYRQLNADSSYTCNSATAVTSFSGLTALEGVTVDIVGDGAVYPPQVVSGGTVTISPAAKKIEVGRHYASTLTTVRPEVSGGGGTSQAVPVRWAEIIIRVFETLGMKVATGSNTLTTLPFRTSADPLGQAPELFTGDLKVNGFSWDEGDPNHGRITVSQDQPLPSTILMLTGVLDIGG